MTADGERPVSPDEFTARRNRKTLEGAVCARSSGPLTQGDYDEIDRFRRFLADTEHGTNRKATYRKYYPEDEEKPNGQ